MAQKTLVVDDSTSMRQMITFTLKGAAYEVVEANDGLQELSASKSQNFDLIFTDVNMPGMDGLTFTLI